MKFHVCCCFFDYYLHIPSTQTIFTVKKSANKDKNYGFTVVLSSDNEIFQPCYKRTYNALLVQIFDVAKMNQLLNQSCQIYHAPLLYLQRINGTAENCFQVISHYLKNDSDSIDRNLVMTTYCYSCFKNLISNFLSDKFYVVRTI